MNHENYETNPNQKPAASRKHRRFSAQSGKQKINRTQINHHATPYGTFSIPCTPLPANGCVLVQRDGAPYREMSFDKNFTNLRQFNPC
jgi:hypothetical protein